MWIQSSFVHILLMTPRRFRNGFLSVLVVCALALTFAAADADASPGASSTLASRLCGGLDSSSAPNLLKHVIWIWMENRSYGQIIGGPGSAAAMNSPYLNGTVVPECGLATNYHNVSHPSLPNYLAAVAGTGGMTSGCSPRACPQSADSIFAEVTRAGSSWGGYDESMPSNCSFNDTSLYRSGHNPALYYTAIRKSCAASDVPMGTTSSGAFQAALHANTLPEFSFVTPNLCDDSHSCSSRTGDSWLSQWLPVITSTQAYQSGGTVVFVTWDEGIHGNTDACATNTSDQGCHVATLILSPYTRPGTKATTLFNHYSLLRTSEDVLGLALLGHAADASSNDMRADFHL
jgi:hypothetical protein